MTKQFLFTCLFLTLSLFSFGQSDGLLVHSIQFEGLKKTKTSYLFHFLQTQEGATFNPVLLRRDEQQLKNLSNLTQVTCRQDTCAEGVNLVFEVQEAYTIFPIVNFGRIKGNFWTKVGFAETNLLGKGIQTSAFYQNIDGRHNFNVFFKLPYISGSKWGNFVSITKYASIEPLYFPQQPVNYNYDNLSLNIGTSYEINFFNRMEIGGTYFIEQYEKTEKESAPATPGPQFMEIPKLMGKIAFLHQKTNYHYFYLWGIENCLRLETVRNIPDEDWFHIITNDFKYFKRVGNTGNWGIRFRMGLSTNNESPFAPFVVSSHVNIRGVGNRINRGTGSLVLNMEYRQTIFDKKNFAGQVVGFTDIGSWRKPGGTIQEALSRDSFLYFAGGGIRFIYKRAFDAILRVDYGIDIGDANVNGWVIGLGQYF